jgi:hypothetical protein
MSNCPHEGGDMLTWYQIYYRQEDERTFEDIMGASAWHILKEDGAMEHLKKFHPGMHLKDDDIWTFAAEGDTLFDQEFHLPIKEREQFEMEGKVQQTIWSCIEHLLHDELYEDVGKQKEEGEDEDDNSVEDDKADEGEEDEDQDDKEEKGEKGEEGEEEEGGGGGGEGEEEEEEEEEKQRKTQKCREDSSEYLLLHAHARGQRWCAQQSVTMVGEAPFTALLKQNS